MSEGAIIEIHQGRRPALGAADVRVIIDVIRAFTTSHVAFRAGATRILLADTLERARSLAAPSSGRVLAGERDALKPEGFDLGNSPAEMDRADVDGRELVLTTSNGVQAAVHALFDGPVFVSGFSNAGSTVEALRRLIDDGARRLQLIASHPEGDEDLACAQWMRARLRGEREPSDEEVMHRIRTCFAAEKFLDPSRPNYGAEDIDYCARRDDSPWAMILRSGGEAPVIETDTSVSGR